MNRKLSFEELLFGAAAFAGLGPREVREVRVTRDPTWCHPTKKGPGRSGTMIRRENSSGSKLAREVVSNMCALKHKRWLVSPTRVNK